MPYVFPYTIVDVLVYTVNVENMGGEIFIRAPQNAGVL